MYAKRNEESIRIVDNVLQQQGIQPLPSKKPRQLTTDIMLPDDLVVFVNKRAVDFAAQVIELPGQYETWDIDSLCQIKTVR